jgi:stalled ribosome rescue protein Dom34
MKLVKKSIDPAGVGYVVLKPQHAEDMWHAYNLIAAGDLVTCATFRKVGTRGDVVDARVSSVVIICRFRKSPALGPRRRRA